MYNSEGQTRVMLGANDLNNGLTIYDYGQRGRLLVGVDPDEKPWIAIGDGNDAQRIKISIKPDGSPSIYLCDNQSRPLLTLGVRDDSHGVFLCYEAGKLRTFLVQFSKHGPSIMMVDENGEIIFYATESESESYVLFVSAI